MPAPRLTAKIGHKTKKGTTVNARHVIGAINDYYDTYLVVQENNVAIISERINDAIVAALEEIGLVAERAAKRLCPVDTGRLRNSITHAFLDDRNIAIGTNVEYALYVHEPVRMRNGKTRQGVPFLRDAATQNVDRYRAILKKHLENS